MRIFGKNQDGWTGFGILGAILSSVIGALSFAGLMRLIPAEASVATPWVLVSLFILPLTYCVQLLFKIFDLKELSGLSKNEKRRLNPIINGKTRQLFIAIIYYVLSAVLVVTLLFFSSDNQELVKYIIVFIGGLLGVSIFSMALIFMEMKELTDFKATIKQRSDDKKNQRASLKRLNHK